MASINSGRFYQEVTSTDAFVEVAMGGVKGFGGTIGNIDIQNTSGNDMTISFDGVAVHGRIKGNSSKVFRQRYETTMFVKSTVGGSAATALIHAW